MKVLLALLLTISLMPAAFAETEVEKALNEVEAAPEPFQMYVSKGDQFFAQKDYVQALVNYKEAVSLKTGPSGIYQKMGDCSAHLGRYKEALVFAQRAV